MHTLREATRRGAITLVEVVSAAALREGVRHPVPADREAIVADYSGKTRVARDERVVGFASIEGLTGTSCANPLVSDVQDPDVRDRLIGLGLKLRDAEHLAQAISDGCDVFLTRDRKTLVSRVDKTRADGTFPFAILVMMPSVLVARLGLSP